MENDVGYFYDGKFKENILMVGQVGCGKTTFVQNLAKHKMFGDIKEIYWLSKIYLSQEREKNISECFNEYVNSSIQKA